MNLKGRWVEGETVSEFFREEGDNSRSLHQKKRIVLDLERQSAYCLCLDVGFSTELLHDL